MNIANIYKSFIHKGLDLLFPRHCLGCGQEKTWLCESCLRDLPRSYSPNEDKIFSVFEYGTPTMKQVIWRLKYKRGLELAETLAKPMYDCLMEELEDELLIMPPRVTLKKQPKGLPLAPIILIPVPLSLARSRERGYNQAEELARQIAGLNPNQFAVRTDIIKKIKNTPTQVSIRNREARLKNLKGAFELTPSLSPTTLKGAQGSSGFLGSIFVIVDDVSTTGATINEIRNLLTDNGANPHRIYGLVVAHG
ncbi:MAG: hypothetical protein WC385_01765 [Candidatus Paceibacterota bacterium]